MQRFRLTRPLSTVLRAHRRTRGSSCWIGEAMEVAAAFPAIGCDGSRPAIWSMSGVMSCASHCEPTRAARAAANVASSEGPSAEARACGAIAIAVLTLAPATTPFRRAFDRSIDWRRALAWDGVRTLGEYRADASLSAWSQDCMYWPLAIWSFEISPLIQRRTSSTFWVA